MLAHLKTLEQRVANGKTKTDRLVEVDVMIEEALDLLMEPSINIREISL